jgi:FG-GAP-like repeat/Subtilase family
LKETIVGVVSDVCDSGKSLQTKRFLRVALTAIVAIASFSLAPSAYSKPVPAKLGNGLGTIYEDYLSKQVTPEQTANNALSALAAGYQASAVQDDSGRYMVTVHLNGERALADVEAALAQSGKFQATAKTTAYRAGVIDGWLAIQHVGAISRIRGISSVVLSLAPQTNVGATTQQGLVQHRVDKIRQDGTGITIAAISDSYNVSTNAIKEANDIASGDLPGAGNPAGNTTPVTVLQEALTGIDEGRGMLQVIHDMAPKARLGFATAGSSQLQFADNIRSLAALPGAPRIVPGFKADIIVDDIIFLAEPMFSDGIVTQGVNDVTAAGTHYFSSAGNNPSTKGYASDFRFIAPTDTPATGSNINLTGVAPALYAGGFHNFRGDGTRDIAQTISRTAGTGPGNSRLVFQWDDPFDKVTPGTQTYFQSFNFTGTPPTVDAFVNVTAGTSTRLDVFAATGSDFDAIVTLTDPNGLVVIQDYDTGTDETIFFTPTVTGNYKVTVAAFGGTVGNFSVQAFANSAVGVTTDFNVLFFAMDGTFISAMAANNFLTNQPIEFTSLIPYPTGASSIQMVITRANTPVGSGANRLRYIFFDGSNSVTVPAEYTSYQYPVIYGHSTARDGHGVAAYSAFRPYIAESFSSPGPSTIVFDSSGNRLTAPEVRQKPDIAAMDGSNTTFFVSDSGSDADTFPNFFGTSCAAPNAAAIAALALQANGGPGSLSVKQMKALLQKSTFPHDLDPYKSTAVVQTSGGVLTITVNADGSNTSAAYASGPIDLKVIDVSYVGTGAIASLTFNLQGGNTTGGNVNTNIPGLVFDTRAAAVGGLPFTLGTLNGLAATDITPAFSVQPPAPSVVGQFSTLALSFAPDSFTGGRGFTFNVDRDEQTTSSLTAPATAGGNSADLWGRTVSLPSGELAPGGVTVTGTMKDGSTFTGVFVNNIGAGYSPLDGYGFLDAQAATARVAKPNDLSGDGKSDILLQNVATSTVSALLMNGTAVSSTANLLNNDPNWTITHTGDFDRDGKADILWRKADGAVTIWTMNGTTVTSTAGLTGADANWNVMHVGDFNGDGYADLLWRNNNGAVTLWLMNGTTIMSAIGLLGPDANWSVSHIGDFNGDGKADILWRNIDGSVTMWLMNGGTVTSAVGILGVDPNWRVSHVADFNGDGKTDLLWRKANGSVTMWLMDGTAVTSATGILGPDAKWNVSHTADFNGDGKADLLWVNYDTEAVTIWLMNGATVTSAAGIYAGFPPGLPRPTLPFFVWRVIQTQDLNGDGKADLVWSKFDGSTTVWLLDGTAVTATSGLTGPGSRVLPTGPLGSTVVLPI